MWSGEVEVEGSGAVVGVKMGCGSGVMALCQGPRRPRRKTPATARHLLPFFVLRNAISFQVLRHVSLGSKLLSILVFHGPSG